MKKNGKLRPDVIAIGGLVAAALLVLVGGYMLLVSPQSSKASKISAQVDDAQTQVIVAEGTQAKPVPFRASDLFRLAKAMPSGSDMPGILLDLSHIAKRSKVTLTSVRPSPPVNLGTGYSAIQVSITVSGGYGAISKFTHLLRTAVLVNGTKGLEVNGRLFDGDNISLAPLSAPSTASSSSSTSSATGAAKKAPGMVPDELSATIALDAFVFGGTPSPSGLAGSGVAVATTTTTTGSAS